MSTAARVQFCMMLCAVGIYTAAGPPVALLAAPPARVKPATVNDDCTRGGCHDGVLTHKVMHGPVAAKKCLDCHAYLDAALHRFQPLTAPDQGCDQCHQTKHKEVLHAPLREGRCTDCHDAHGSEHVRLLRADPKEDLCRLCHQQQDDLNLKPVHSASNSGACSACHEPHSADQPQLLRHATPSLCTNCHQEMRVPPGTMFSMHVPARDNCVACHDPHVSKDKHGLKQSPPQLCLSCHENLKDSTTSGHVHGAMTQEDSCLSCHVPHFSKLSKLQKEPQPQQCLNCHNRTIKSSGGSVLPDMAALLRENPEHHGPIRLGACTACHQPHGSDQPKLLSAAYPPEFYAPFKVENYQLCFSCHSPDLVLIADASAPTGFKDGERNLHALHVNQERGRTCRACHEVHASRQPFHIPESVPYGPNGWAISLKYRRTETGGTCEAACHVEKSYDNGARPKTLSVVALTAKGQELVKDESLQSPPPTTAPVHGGNENYPVAAPPFTPGVFPCTACHDPMVAVNTERRELRKPHEDIKLQHDEQHRWCLDCHNTQNRDVLRSASGEAIPFAESHRLCGQCHGNVYRDWKSGVHGKRSGEWDGQKQYLLCVHCHDPHSPKFKKMTPLPPPARPNSR